MITFTDFSFKYGSGTKNAVDSINLVIEDGDFLGITGPGGAGKTTLTYAMSGVVPHHFGGDFYGEVKVDGMDTVEVQPEDIAAVLGSVFQDIDAQLVAMNVYEEMLFGLENFGVPHDEIPGRIDEALRMIGISDLKDRDIASLSGGQKQKVAVAAIIALKPKYLVLDEPTGELDPQSSRRVFELLKELNKAGITVVVVEQKIMLLCEFVKHLAVMENGKIILCGTTAEVLGHSDIMEKTGINIPRVVSLAKRLTDAGVYSGDAPVNIESAAKMVKQVTGA